MLIQIRLQSKRLLTTSASKIFGRWVCLHVRPQVWSVCKWFSANIAGVRLVSGVGAEVSLQQPGTGESFATELALVVEVVGEDVHGEGGHADIHLAADVTLLGISWVQTAVGLPMSTQIAAGGIVFATVGACVLRLLALLIALLASSISYWKFTAPTAVVAVVVDDICCVVVEEGLQRHRRPWCGEADGGRLGGGGQSGDCHITGVRDRGSQRHMVAHLGARAWQVTSLEGLDNIYHM